MRTLLLAPLLLCGWLQVAQDADVDAGERHPLAVWIEAGAETPAEVSRTRAAELYRLAGDLAYMPRAERPEPWDEAEIWAGAERAARAAGIADYEAAAARNRADALIAAGARAEAREVLDRACASVGERAVRLGPWLFCDRAAAARYGFDFATAFADLNRARSLADRLKGAERSMLLATVEGQLLRLSLKLGRLDRAAIHAEREAELAEASGDPASKTAARMRRIRIAEAALDHEEVIEEVEAWLAEPAKPSKRTRAELALMRARALLERARGGDGDVAGAIEFLLTTSESPDLIQGMRTLPLLAAAANEARLGRFERAERLHAEAAGLFEAALARSEETRILQDRAALDAFAARITTERVAAGDLDLGDPEARALAASRLASLERSAAGFFGFWSKLPPMPGGVGFLQYGTRSSVVGELAALTMAMEPGENGRRKALEHVLRAQALGSLGRRLGTPVPSLDEVRAALVGERGGLVVFLFAYAASHAFIVDRDGVSHVSLPPARAFAEPRRRLAVELALRPRSAPESVSYNRACRRAEKAATRLADLLLPDGLREAIDGWEAVQVAGLSDLGTVPFECLPDANGLAFGRTRAISNLPSVPLAVWLAGRSPRRSTSTLAIGSPSHADAVAADWPGLAPLGLSAQDLAPLGTGEGSRVVVAAQASEDALARAGSVGVLHLFTHGVYDSYRAEPSGLLLAPTEEHPSGVFWCEDARQLEAPPVVVLSVCGAARTPLRRGEDGSDTFTGAFFEAGSRAVVVSSFDLDAAATLELGGALARELERGAAPAEALRAARDRIARDPRWAHPSYHATMRVVGLGLD